MSFGSLFREERVRSRRNLREVAAHLGFSLVYLSDVERGERLPFAPSKIIAAAQFLGIDPDPLLAAAIVTRGVAKLDAMHVTDKHRVVGAALARAWTSLTPEQLSAIAAVIERKGGAR